MMQANATRIGYGRVLAATFITALGWGLSWCICLLLLFFVYLDSSVSQWGVIYFNFGYGLIGISVTLLGLWLMRVRLSLTHIVILYAVWGLSCIGSMLIANGNATDISNNVFNIMPIHVTVFGLAASWLLTQMLEGLTWREGSIMSLAWIVTMFFSLKFYAERQDPRDALAWLMAGTPLAAIISAALGSGVMYFFIRRAKNNSLVMLEKQQTAPVALGELLQSDAQQVTFEVVHDDGKLKAKRKPKPEPWLSIPHWRIYIAGLVAVVVLAVGISLVVAPVREVRVPGFITPNPTNSTPGPQWGNRLPPTSPHWGWNASAMTNSPVGEIAARNEVNLQERYYDFGAEMWWYKAVSLDGHTGDAWEWQLDPLNAPPPVTTVATVLSTVDLDAPFPRTLTPINDVITLGQDSGYQVIARAFDGGNWQYTLQAADGSSQTVDAAMVNLGTNEPLPTAPYMALAGTMKAALVTRESVGAILPRTPVQVIKIIWYGAKPPSYLITPDANSPQPIVAEAQAEQLEAMNSAS